MDIDGVDAEVLFPPQRTIGHFLGDEDDDFVLAGIEAYNNFLWRGVLRARPDRLVGMAQIPSTGVDDAVDGAAQGEGPRLQGRRDLVLAGRRRRAISDDDDAFWAAAAGRGHAGVHPHQPDLPQGPPAGPQGGGQGRRARSSYGDGKRSKASAKAAAGLAGVFSTVPSTIGQLIFTGVFERFPEPAHLA